MDFLNKIEIRGTARVDNITFFIDWPQMNNAQRFKMYLRFSGKGRIPVIQNVYTLKIAFKFQKVNLTIAFTACRPIIYMKQIFRRIARMISYPVK